MKKLKIATLGMCTALVFSCGTATKNGALIGAGGGALLGAIVGKIAGNTGVGAAVGAAVGTGAGALIGKHMDKVKAQAAADLEKAKVEEITDANGLKAVKVTFDAGLLFASGKSDLAAASKTELNNFANVLKENTLCSVAIQGYSDNDPWKGATAEQSKQKNIDLSQQRADAVKSYLNGQGVTNSQIKASTGFGEANPVVANDTPANKALNRRVEVYLYASEQMVEAANNGTLN